MSFAEYTPIDGYGQAFYRVRALDRDLHAILTFSRNSRLFRAQDHRDLVSDARDRLLRRRRTTQEQSALPIEQRGTPAVGGNEERPGDEGRIGGRSHPEFTRDPAELAEAPGFHRSMAMLLIVDCYR